MAEDIQAMNSSETIATTATVVHEAGDSGHHVEPSALGLTSTAWVALAMICVILLLLVKKVPALIGAALDRKIATIREQLAEAAALRAEAEAVKAEYERKSAAATKEAADIVAHARDEANAIVERAKADAGALIERRTRMAQDKIAAAERAAVAELRAKAASAAAVAAAALIAESHDKAADKALVDQGIGSLRLN